MFAVIACKKCQQPWTVETRSAASTCPRCSARNELRRRTRLWEGADAREAQQVAGHLRASLAKGIPPEAARLQVEKSAAAPLPRHDSPLDAAAAKARAVVNRSERADTVALWLTRLLGDAPHDQYMEALRKAGLTTTRAEREIVRMLATDVVFEPVAGHYRML